MGSIAKSTFTRHGSQWTVDIREDGFSTELALNITGLSRTQGGQSAALVSPVLPSRLALSLRDPAGGILQRIQNNPLSSFSVQVKKDGSVYHEGPLIESKLGETNPQNPKLTLRFGGVLKRLGRPNQMLTPTGAGDDVAVNWRAVYEPAGGIYQTIGRIPACILHSVTDQPVRTYWNYRHEDAVLASRTPPEAHRTRVMDIGRDQFPSSRQRALKQFCNTWGLQAVQQGGKIWLLERAMRGQSSAYAEHDTTGSFPLAGSGEESRLLPLTDDEIRDSAPITPLIRRAKYTSYAIGRYVATADTDPYAINAADDLEDMWATSGATLSVQGLVFTQDNHTAKRKYPWERHDRGANSDGEMTITIDVEVDVKSGATFDGGAAFLKVGTLIEKDGSTRNTTSLDFQVTDQDAGTTATKTFSIPVADQKEARVEFEFTQDPDSDNQNELTEMRLPQVEATWAGPIEGRAPSTPFQRSWETVNGVVTTMGVGGVGLVGDNIPQAGTLGVYTQSGYQGSAWERLLPETWAHPLYSDTPTSPTFIAETLLDAQIQPTTDPLEGWQITQDLEAQGDITFSYDYKGRTFVPIYLRETLMGGDEGTRTMRMLELRT